jgi:hypothetical protein
MELMRIGRPSQENGAMSEFNAYDGHAGGRRGLGEKIGSTFALGRGNRHLP